jgi:Fe-S-cluster containining protein
MSACDTCCSPGACCREFVLNFYVPADNWSEAARDKMDAHNMPFFRPKRVYPLHEGQDRVQVLFSCDRIGPDGRCTRYDERPETCRVYEPGGKDGLCVRREPRLRGIPIVAAPSAADSMSVSHNT